MHESRSHDVSAPGTADRVHVDRVLADPVETAPFGPSRPAWFWLVVIAVVFLALRLPVIYLQPGGQDEDCYAVPGLTILQTGIPRLPHVPARNPESVYYEADLQLYSEPPLYFYYQSLFYALLPDVYGTARLSSVVAGLALLGLVYQLGITLGLSTRASLWGAALLGASRWFYFPAICARPDILCVAFGVGAVINHLRWTKSRRIGHLIPTGILLGLGGLTHPFAIVYALQLGVWTVWTSRGWQRLRDPAILTIAALVTFSAWLPLIAMYPDTFQRQMHNQFGGNPDQSLLVRLVSPIPSLTYHTLKVWEQIGPIQCLLAVAGLLGGSLLNLTDAAHRLRPLGLLAGTSIYLLSTTVGPHHPVIGYWAYPAAFCFLLLAHGLEQLAHWWADRRRLTTGTTSPTWIYAGIFIVALALMLPGAGLRTLATHLRYWNDINYNEPRFAARLIEAIPPDAVCAVDTQFVLDFVAAGRPTLLATTEALFFRVDQFSYDLLVISRYGDDRKLARELGATLLRTEGLRDDLFACYAEIYQPANTAREANRP